MYIRFLKAKMIIMRIKMKAEIINTSENDCLFIRRVKGADEQRKFVYIYIYMYSFYIMRTFSTVNTPKNTESNYLTVLCNIILIKHLFTITSSCLRID